MTTESIGMRAGLAGALALASGSASYGAIVSAASLPADTLIGVAGGATSTGPLWDVDGDATADFQFQYGFPNSATQRVWAGFAAVNAGAAVVGYNGAFIPYASNLAAATVVGPSSTFFAGIVLGSHYAGLAYGGFGSLTGSVRGLMGFRFNNVAGAHFGWADIEVFAATGAGSTGTVGIRVYAAAYETDVNTAIPAGAVPTPGALSALALGAAGLLRRKQRSAA